MDSSRAIRFERLARERFDMLVVAGGLVGAGVLRRRRTRALAGRDSVAVRARIETLLPS